MFRLLWKLRLKKLRKAMDAYPKKLYQAIRKEWVREAKSSRKRFISQRLSGRPGVERESGELQRSTQSKIEGNDLSSLLWRLSIGKTGKAKKYAQVQDQGMVIRAKGKFMAIPLTTPRPPWPSKTGLNFVVIGRFLRAEGGGGPNYRLADSVYVPGRVKIANFVRKNTQKFLAAARRAKADL